MWTEECGYYLVEWYRPEFTAHDLDAIVAGLSGGAIASATDSGSAPTLIAVLAAPADEVVYGLFAAASPDSVIAACAHAGTPAERLTSGVDARILESQVR
ncbi:Uncharacterised protein [Mycolicibacterium vanbaalenii]|uniref:DUF4242 domain-containing protein n=1 Tax=Mycolicibacterium vanbaalenii TaxID=110539 RepID=A0A5S9MVI0_MYCVN|nr:hypothetical protein [Mycolicibacterium vanbaalenii]CAA0081109.1 Uncharacterised protein [Mycolicibacterium vanbaalenii]